jgi:amphiphysin
LARDTYETINRQLITEIPKLIDLRVAYLHPSFEALVKSQLQFNEDAFYALDSIGKSFPSGTSGGMASLEGQVEASLQKMKELTICRSMA